MKKLKDYYGILGIGQDADLKEIKKAYKDYAFLYHPDRTAGLSDSARQKAEVKMKEVNEAYEILSHPDKRKKYNSEWLQGKAETSESQQSSDNVAMKPRPKVEPSLISFKDVIPGKVLTSSFIVYNDGGPFVNFYVDPPNPPLSWIRIVGAKSISSEQFPLRVEIEVEGQGWGTTHSTVLKVRMDDQETEVKIRLQTKSEPIRTNPPFQKTSTPRSPSYQSVPKNQGDSSKQKLGGYVVLIALALVIFVIVKIANFLEKPKVEKSTVTNVQPATTQKSSILRLISGGENLLIESLDGKATIPEAKEIFKDIYNFEKWGLNQPGQATGATLMDVYEMTRSGTYVQIFTEITTDLDKIVMSQAQVIRFCKKYPTWLYQTMSEILFLIKVDGKYYVVSVKLSWDGLNVYPDRFGHGYIYHTAHYHYRVVSPRLIPLAN